MRAFIANLIMGIAPNGSHYPAMGEQIFKKKNESAIFLVGLFGELF